MRYASGYLYNGPSDTLVGAQASHAWAEVYLPGAGWVGLDPTSGLLTGEGHIPLAAKSFGQLAQGLGRKLLDEELDQRVADVRTLSHSLLPPVLDELGLRDDPDQAEIAGAKAKLLKAYRWLEEWLGANTLPPHVSLVTCAAAPSLFYGDWVERIPADCPRLAALRAELKEHDPELLDVLERKKQAIFRHQSQKDRAMFPGGTDRREFWQRAEDRNTTTAAR